MTALGSIAKIVSIQSHSIFELEVRIKSQKPVTFGKLQAFIIVRYDSQWENESYNRTGKFCLILL